MEEHSEVREQPKKKRRKNEKYTEIPMEEIPAEAREQPSAAVSKKEEKALKKKRDAARIEQESLERGEGAILPVSTEHSLVVRHLLAEQMSVAT